MIKYQSITVVEAMLRNTDTDLIVIALLWSHQLNRRAMACIYPPNTALRYTLLLLSEAHIVSVEICRLQRLARSISYAKLLGIAFHQQASSFLPTWPSVLGESDLAFKKTIFRPRTNALTFRYFDEVEGSSTLLG